MGYFNEKNFNKFKAALFAYRDEIAAGARLSVSISKDNIKMGNVASVSLLPIFSCHCRCRETCRDKCYAVKLVALRPPVRDAYARNTALAMYAPENYWQQIRGAALAFRYFRFHVSGDILNRAYFAEMIETARAIPGTNFIAFTKKYEIVNAWIAENGELPGNLKILFSGWTNLVPENPHGLPETTVYARAQDFKPEWKSCGGNCFNCACRGLGCWQAKAGDIIAFKMH